MAWGFRSPRREPAAQARSERGQTGKAGRDKAGWRFEEGAEIATGRTVLEPLGGGRRYDVYLVWDERLHALAVAKLLRPDLLQDASAVRKLQREAELLERLAHPALVRAFDAVLEAPYPHLLLEHLDGPNLRRLVKQDGPLAVGDVLAIGVQIAAALHYLSVEQVVHLDVKPSNVVLGEAARLIDLGAARSIESASRLRVPLGTDAFMAPELCGAASGAGGIDAAADIWGLGATLYYASTGQVPFPRPAGAKGEDDPTVRFPQLVTRPEPMPSYVPAALETLLLRMLTPDPSERPGAADVGDELAAL